MTLSADRVTEILAFLGVDRAAPTLELVDRLIQGYTQRVPWESASRIARRAGTRETADCPRWPDRFWSEALTRGTGGTCFESNYAFLAILESLGFDGYLTINDMGEKSACHTAIVLRMKGQAWLVDMGLPVYTRLRIDPAGPTYASSPFHDYAVRPRPDGRYDIDRSHHPKPVAFTLIDRPVDDERYRRATTADYDPGGHFLDRVVVTKIVNGRQWRFVGDERPWCLETFDHGVRAEYPLDEDPAPQIAARFGVDRAIITEALNIVHSHDGPPVESSGGGIAEERRS